MASDHAGIAATALRVHAAALGATAETGTRALRASMLTSAGLARDTVAVLRAPQDRRATAFEQALRSCQAAQSGQLHALRGMATLWGMAFLCRMADPAAQDRR